MTSAGLTFLIVVALELMLSEVDGQKACSCYTFENGGLNRMTWLQARSSCEFHNKYLVVMETSQEWEFINKAIRNRTAVPNNEWHIGLWKNRTTAQWTWINGKRLTIAKWQRDKPEQNDFYAVIFKGWPRPHSSHGLFDSIQGDIRRGWICEEETDNCQGVCMHRHPSPTSTAPPKSTSPSATEDREHSSASGKTSTSLSHSVDTLDSKSVILFTVLASLLHGSRGTGQIFKSNCSSYTVHTPPKESNPNWKESVSLCRQAENGSALVSIETQAERNFLKKKLLENNLKYEYFIGLEKYNDTLWKWVSGNRTVTSLEWVSGNGNCAKMYFQRSGGLVHTVYDDIGCETEKGNQIGYICERPTYCEDDCTGECVRHSPTSTTTAPPRMSTSASLTESKKSSSTARGQANTPDSTESTTSATVPNKGEENGPKIAAVAACVGAVLFLALIGLAVVLVLRRKKRRGKDAEKPKMSCSKQTEPQYESAEPAAEAARLLGKHEVNITANSEKEQPKVESEYAVVNKANKKPKKGDLVYAQLAEFDDTNNDLKAAEKPATYEPTVYAEVVPSDVYHEASPDSSQPTYENVKNTGV